MLKKFNASLYLQVKLKSTCFLNGVLPIGLEAELPVCSSLCCSWFRTVHTDFSGCRFVLYTDFSGCRFILCTDFSGRRLVLYTDFSGHRLVLYTNFSGRRFVLYTDCCCGDLQNSFRMT